MSDYFDRVERQIARRVTDGVPRSRRIPLTLGHLGLAAAVLVVIVIAGVFLAARGGGGGRSAPAAHPALRLQFTAASGDDTAIDQSLRLLRERLHAELPGAQVARTGANVTVTLAHASAGARSEILALAAPGRLAFYDWEADVITPNGKTVASQLSAQAPAALEISQGRGSAGPGANGAGCVGLEQALALARKLKPSAPRPTEYVGDVILQVPTGFVVLSATDAFAQDPGVYLLKAVPTLTNPDVVNPRASREPNTGISDVTFGFTAAGRHAFQAVTATIARRGNRVSRHGVPLNQHFAIALDNRLISVPSIDYKQYPDGISGANGADIAGNFTAASAKLTAILLRYGPLPVPLTAAG